MEKIQMMRWIISHTVSTKQSYLFSSVVIQNTYSLYLLYVSSNCNMSSNNYTQTRMWFFGGFCLFPAPHCLPPSSSPKKKAWIPDLVKMLLWSKSRPDPTFENDPASSYHQEDMHKISQRTEGWQYLRTSFQIEDSLSRDPSTLSKDMAGPDAGDRFV